SVGANSAEQLGIAADVGATLRLRELKHAQRDLIAVLTGGLPELVVAGSSGKGIGGCANPKSQFAGAARIVREVLPVVAQDVATCDPRRVQPVARERT